MQVARPARGVADDCVTRWNLPRTQGYPRESGVNTGWSALRFAKRMESGKCTMDNECIVHCPLSFVRSLYGAERSKAFAVREGPAAYQLVGGVTAYQGDDG